MNVAKRVLRWWRGKRSYAGSDAYNVLLGGVAIDMKGVSFRVIGRGDQFVVGEGINPRTVDYRYLTPSLSYRRYNPSHDGSQGFVCTPGLFDIVDMRTVSITDVFTVAPVELEARELGRWLSGGDALTPQDIQRYELMARARAMEIAWGPFTKGEP